MQLSACPKCAMPRAEADIAERPCPLCGYVIGQEITPYVDEPPAPMFVAEPTPSVAAVAPPERNQWPLIVAVGVLAAAGLGFFLGRQFSPTKTAEVKTTVPVEVVRYEKEPPKKVETPPQVPAIELAPMPREVEEVPPAPPAVQLPGGVSLIRFNRPDETYTLERVGEGNVVKLVGRLGKLVVHGLDGGATLDAGELDVKHVSITGNVEGNARLKLHATENSVNFSKPVSGGAQIEIDAPNAQVWFIAHAAGSVGAPVSGGTKMKIRCKSLWFSRAIEGGSTVEVTLGNGGSLKFTELLGNSRLHYRSEKPDDMVKILPGRIDESSECKKLD